MKQFRFAALLLLVGCAVAPPAPVYEAARDLPVEEKPEPQVRRPQTHIIGAGETLAGIALEYGLDYQELAQWNDIHNPDSIYAGDIIRLSRPESLAVASAVAPQKSATLAPAPIIAKPGAPADSAIAPAVAYPSAAETASAAARGDAPIKNEPAAAKYAYSKQTLAKLRAAHEADSASSAAPSPAQIVRAAPAPAPDAGAPQRVRRRFDVDWSWPAAGEVTRKFSEASKGMDIVGAKGAPVYAAADGKVVYTGSGVKSYGRLVILKHGNDYLSAYAHNDKILVKEGQKIARGEQISTLGDSGATQAMLHLEIRKSGKPFDPLQVLPPQP